MILVMYTISSNNRMTQIVYPAYSVPCQELEIRNLVTEAPIKTVEIWGFVVIWGIDTSTLALAS